MNPTGSQQRVGGYLLLAVVGLAMLYYGLTARAAEPAMQGWLPILGGLGLVIAIAGIWRFIRN